MRLDVKIALINLVSQHPILYNPTAEHYKNTRGPYKNLAWAAVMADLEDQFPDGNLNLTMQIIKKEWQSTKNAYRIDIQEDHPQQNPFHEQMAWYRPFVNLIIVHPLEAEQTILFLSDENQELRVDVANLQAEVQELEQSLQEEQIARQRVTDGVLNLLFE